ncbi:MAG TPA: PAS domain-containing protein [Roseiarcus sp.]
MKLAATRELFAYWTALRAARSAPERNDVDPGAIRGILADTFILEHDLARDFPMRVVGTRTNALFLRELRGSPFAGLWREQDRSEMRAILASVADEAQPFLIGAVGAPRGFAPIDLEILLLPLRHHGDTHARLLGCCAPGSSPPWLGLAGFESLALLTLRAISPRDGAGPSSGMPEFARGPHLPRRGHLFLALNG